MEEREGGITRLLLITSPAVGPLDQEKLRQTFLRALEQSGAPERVEVWRRAGTAEVRRQWPVVTKAGKVLPFHLERRESGTAGGPVR